MKNLILLCTCLVIASSIIAQDIESIPLNPPNTQRGLPVMEALSLRASVSKFDTTSLPLQDLSDLLWAANGINRSETGKRTAPSAINAQDIDVYAFLKTGIYIYNARKHHLELVDNKDYRSTFFDKKDAAISPVIFLAVSDISRFRFGETAQRLEWAAMDAALVTQNILIFCASVNLASRPRASMDKTILRKILKLDDSQHPMLNIPVSYKK